MKVIGLDFGTTNSILSFYNEQTKNIESWKMGGVDGNNYIPSFLTIEDDEISIGNEAKENVLYGENVESYSKFKMLLSEKDAIKLKNYGYLLKKPKEIATAYIKKLLDTYIQEQKINKIEKIVVSIPEIWIKDDLIARSELESVLKDLNLPNVEFKSEPVSAGAYFLHRYKENHNENFNGHFIIFDFGGGTLDISLLESCDNHMKILERTGRGHSDDFIGKAGVAYDQYVVKKALLQQHNKVLADNDKTLLALFIEFEKRKISKTDKIPDAIEKYRKIKKDTPIFTVEKKQFELSITPSLLIESFDELVKDDIVDSLSEIKKYFDFYNIDITNDKKFKIVLVGGFSSFYLSQRIVMDFFGSVTLSDKRFEQDFTKDDLALSISKGAALLAKDIIVEEQTYPMSMGVILYTPSGDELIEIILKKGDSVIVNKTIFLPHNITTGKPTIYFDDGAKKGIIKLNEKIESLYPNAQKANNSWNFGFSVDSNNFYYLHIKDKDGEDRKTEFSHLINEFKDRTYIQKKEKMN